MKEHIKNLPIKKKLNFLTNAFIIGLVVLGMAACLGAFILNAQTSSLANDWLVAVELAGEMNTLTSEYRMKQYGHVVSSTEEEFTMFEQEIERLDKEIEVVRETYEKTISADTDRQLYNTACAAWEDYKEATGDEFYKLSRNMQLDEANAIMLGEGKTAYDTFVDCYSQLVEYNSKGAKTASNQANLVFMIVVVAVITIVAVAIVIGLKISKVVVSNVVDPTMQLVEAAAGLRRGDLKASKVLTYEADDEIAELVKNTRESMEVIDGYVEEISDILIEISKGVLTKDEREITDFLGEFGTIKESLVLTLKRFNSTLTKINETASLVDTGSAEIANAATSLAEGTTDEASAIEELTATVETVANMATESAKSTAEAYERVNKSVKDAEVGREQMKLLTKEMENITDISKEIANIITAIEDIASQTNLLSLNASIEAARAGEAGRGFAVVADQIGKLASDSAASAVSTRQLIEKTLEEIGKGNESTIKTSEAFEKIIDDMKEFAVVAKNTRENAEGQAEALEQITDGIEQISGVVQNTAASAQESTAISEQLSGEAKQMAKLVHRFQLFGLTGKQEKFDE